MTLTKKGGTYKGGRYGRFAPPQLDNLRGWYDASDTGTITLNGANVSQWNDKSGNNFHLVQATDARQPFYNIGWSGGRNSLLFDGTNSAMTSDLSVTQPNTAFAVVDQKRAVFADKVYDGRGVRQTMETGAANAMQIWAGAFLSSILTYVLDVPFIFQGTYNGAVSRIYFNNVVTNGNPGTQNLSQLIVGSRFTYTSLWWGNIAELIFYDDLLSDNERYLVYTYLKNKWSV